MRDRILHISGVLAMRLEQLRRSHRVRPPARSVVHMTDPIDEKSRMRLSFSVDFGLPEQQAPGNISI